MSEVAFQSELEAAKAQILSLMYANQALQEQVDARKEASISVEIEGFCDDDVLDVVVHIMLTHGNLTVKHTDCLWSPDMSEEVITDPSTYAASINNGIAHISNENPHDGRNTYILIPEEKLRVALAEGWARYKAEWEAAS